MGIDVISSSANKGMQVYASTGQMLVQAQIAGLLAGELQTVNRMAGGAITAYGTVINTSATTVVRTGACVVYGLLVISTGGAGANTVSVWDGVSTAAGTTIVSSAAITAVNTVVPIGPVGVGMLFTTGMTVQQSTASAVYPLLAF